MASTMTTTIESGATNDLVELTTKALQEHERGKGKQQGQCATVDENGVEYTSSRPPSPPSTGASTPTLRIAPCPPRLWAMVPPPQYGVVEDYTIFRSSYPQDRNMDFIKSLEIKSILTLVETEATPGYTQWLDEFHIKQGKVAVAPNKEAKEGKKASATSMDSISEALIFALDGSNYPLWIHCNQGRHRTGCVVACLRKLQGKPIDEVIDEYIAYADPKARPGDIAFIKAFEPRAVFEYAKKTGLIGCPDAKILSAGPTPIDNVYELAHALACRGRQDSVTSEEMETAVENLSTAVSEVSIGAKGGSSKNLAEMGAAAAAVDAAVIEEIGHIDPRLQSKTERDDGYDRMAIEIVEVDDRVESVDSLALHGGLDAHMDPEEVAAALA